MARAAVFYIARGGQYVSEAVVSAESIAREMPELDRWLFTLAGKPRPGVFTHIVSAHDPQRQFWSLNCMSVLVGQALPALREYDSLVWLDTDTYVCRKFDDVFTLLEKYDLAGAHAPGRLTCNAISTVPNSFPELNIGFLAFRNSEPVREFWKEVLGRYEANASHYRNNDQTPLREALWANRTLRVATLAPEYNCRFCFGCFVRGPVRVLHGRPEGGDYEAVRRSINASNALRVWKHGRWEAG